MATLSEDKRLLTYDIMSQLPEVTCFTTTRHGGCSSGNYGTMNCGPYTGDDPENVRRNLQTLADMLPQRPRMLVIPEQVHGCRKLVVDSSFADAGDDRRRQMLEGIDVLLTREPGFCLCISTADCIPLVFYDRRLKAAATAHAGWRGTRSRVASAALAAMTETFGTRPEDVVAVMGPGISMGGFEVGDEVYQDFKSAGFDMTSISEWKPKTHKYHLNLWIANRMQIIEAGVPESQIEMAGICTWRKYTDFFSARRLGNDSGRMLTGIMINED